MKEDDGMEDASSLHIFFQIHVTSSIPPLPFPLIASWLERSANFGGVRKKAHSYKALSSLLLVCLFCTI
jgi:hypothetical protein